MIPRLYARKAIRPEMTVRQMVADFPAAEDVFRRHGEQDAPPARFGHLEPLTHFARRNGLLLDSLLSELRAATAAPVELRGRFAERLHHGFILSALALTLTLGAGWGAWLLWQIGMQGQFSGVPAAYVIAHGEAQLWGFVVLFVMGVALRTVMQGVVQLPNGVWICRALLTLALVGVGGSMFWSLAPESFAPLGLISAASLLLLSLGFWGLQIALLRTKWPATWARAVLVSGLWLTAWAVVTSWLRRNVGDAGPGIYSDAQRLLLIELAVFGFAMNSIYGFGQMLLPGLLRIGSTRDWAIEVAHWLHNAGAIVVCLATRSVSGSLSMVVGSVLLVSGAVLFAFGHRGFVGRRRASHSDAKGHAPLDYYPPLAFFWLLASLALMAGGVVYEAVAKNSLPHAYMGAVRHALTVGFMTTLILGVGQRMAPVLDRTVLAIPRLVVPILLLIGVGNLWRVGTELATLLTPIAYHVMPVSALLEWSALLLFAVNMVATMFHSDPVLKRGRVTKRSSLAVLVAEHPWIEDRLRPTGTRYLERTRCVPDELTVGAFAEYEGLDSAKLVAEINVWLADRPSIGRSNTSPAGDSQHAELSSHRK
ncbi:MAG: hypothetical protein IT427_15545 [Pirellulales bacterium]|nr:hypothetical protein [Pirellulales bacterium]